MHGDAVTDVVRIQLIAVYGDHFESVSFVIATDEKIGCFALFEDAVIVSAAEKEEIQPIVFRAGASRAASDGVLFP